MPSWGQVMAILEAYVAGDCRGITAASWICNFSCVLEYLIYGVIESDDDEAVALLVHQCDLEAVQLSMTCRSQLATRVQIGKHRLDLKIFSCH